MPFALVNQARRLNDPPQGQNPDRSAHNRHPGLPDTSNHAPPCAVHPCETRAPLSNHAEASLRHRHAASRSLSRKVTARLIRARIAGIARELLTSLIKLTSLIDRLLTAAPEARASEVEDLLAAAGGLTQKDRRVVCRPAGQATEHQCRGVKAIAPVRATMRPKHLGRPRRHLSRYTRENRLHDGIVEDRNRLML